MKNLRTYGLKVETGESHAPVSQAQIELACLAMEDPPREKAEHFWAFCLEVWPPDHETAPMVRNPTSEKIVERFYKYRELAISGHSSSTKSDIVGALCLVSWLAEPKSTLCYITSTDKQGARRRIWGHVTSRYEALPEPRPGRCYESGEIRMKGPGYGDKQGLYLVAGDPSNKRGALDKIIGIKALGGLVILVLDEATSLSPGLTDAYYQNIRSNRRSKLVAMGNFKSPIDPFGLLCTPIDGWDSVNVDVHEWDADYDGRKPCHVIRFDALKSPNWLAQEDIYPFMLQCSEIQKYIGSGGENTPEFWRFIRSFICPSSVDMGKPYNEMEVLQHMKRGSPPWAEGYPKVFCGIDPAFVTGGDACIAQIVKVGMLVDGSWALDFKETPKSLQIDSRQRDRGPAFQICDQVKDLHIESANLGFDASNDAFMNVVWAEIAVNCHSANFNGSASDRITSATDPRPSIKRFGNRMTEVWMIGLDFLRAGMIWNLPKYMVEDMCAREWREADAGGGMNRKRLEPKDWMKRRIGRSPDHADAGFVALDVAITRFPILMKAARGKGLAPGQVSGISDLARRNNVAGYTARTRYSTLANRFPELFRRGR